MRIEGLTFIAPQLLERLERFQCLTVAHPRLLAARDQLMDVIDGSLPGSLILVLGPTGVGKTTLRCKLEQFLAEQMASVLIADPGRLPFVSVEATVPEASRFRWRDYFSQFLAGAREPLIERKVPLNCDYLPPTGSLTGSQLEQAAVQLLRYRRPAAVFIDEAQHLSRVASGRRLIDQLDVIKSMANRTQTPHVLFGTYELLAFRNLSSQLSRRSVDLHFPRYRAESGEDIQIFKNVLGTFQDQFPTLEPPDLIQHWEFLYERCVGCVGVLKDWLMRAAIGALKSAERTVNLAAARKNGPFGSTMREDSRGIPRGRNATCRERRVPARFSKVTRSPSRRHKLPSPKGCAETGDVETNEEEKSGPTRSSPRHRGSNSGGTCLIHQ